VLRIAVRSFRMGAHEALDFGTVAGGLGVTPASVHRHFGVATMPMSLPAEREPDSFSRRMRGWLSALSPRQEGTNPGRTG